MTGKTLTIDLPEDLASKLEAHPIDVRHVVIEALQHELNRSKGPKPPMTKAEIEAAIQESERLVASGQAKLRILGLHEGQGWMSEDFDAPLPDEFWFGDETP
jgi:hypothetical protein